MRITFALAAAILFTVLLAPRQVGHAASYAPQVGRYAIVRTAEGQAVMVDTATGAVWEKLVQPGTGLITWGREPVEGLYTRPKFDPNKPYYHVPPKQ
jgi:hypothetical protein